MARHYTAESIQSAVPSQNSQLLQEWEGYRYDGYVPGNSIGSGITFANGVDMGSKTPESLLKMGVPKSIVDKLSTANVFGLKGQKARDRLVQLKGSNPDWSPLSRGEIATLGNVVDEDFTRSIAKDVGAEDWNSRSPGMQAIMKSMRWQYGEAGYKKTKAYKQWREGDIEGLRANMADWGDKSKDLVNGRKVVGKTAAAINNRYAEMGQRFLPQSNERLAAVGTTTPSVVPEAGFNIPPQIGSLDRYKQDNYALAPAKNNYAKYIAANNPQQNPGPIVEEKQNPLTSPLFAGARQPQPSFDFKAAYERGRGISSFNPQTLSASFLGNIIAIEPTQELKTPWFQ